MPLIGIPGKPPSPVYGVKISAMAFYSNRIEPALYLSALCRLSNNDVACKSKSQHFDLKTLHYFRSVFTKAFFFINDLRILNDEIGPGALKRGAPQKRRSTMIC